ncbi:SpdA protein, partial [Streptomyces longispororuber]|nr:SpdA protein [Streptomyces longispororuber]
PAPALPEVPVPVPAMEAPPALVAHARKVADDHQARTGQPIDLDTLRARLNVPPAMADAIATQLT